MPETVSDIADLFQYYKSLGKVIACIEIVQMRPDDKDGKQYRIVKMLKNYTTLKNVMEIMDIPFIEVSPRMWMKKLNLLVRNEEYSDRKKRLKEVAIRYFPNENVTLQKSDSMLIAFFLFNMYKNDSKFIEDRIPRKVLDRFI
jgi:hypothetical protein